MAQSLAEAAAAYCAIRERERALKAGLRTCERLFENRRGQWLPCWKAYEPSIDTYDGGLIPMPTNKWCPTCLDNAPRALELRRLRKQIGGYASAMFAAYRREKGPDDAD